MKYIIGAYSQLPFGCSEDKLNAMLTNTLKPLLTETYTHPDRKLLLHLSVNEYEWLEMHHPEINMLIYDLCKKNQLELLSGSYYDVMLPLIPAHERSIQLEKSNTYIRKRFGKRPKGMWCCQQYFSPLLIPAMAMSSLEYTVISSYSQSQNCTMATRPFWIDEMGRSALILPSDDKIAREIEEYKASKNSEEKLIASIQKAANSTKDSCQIYMINLDQILNLERPQSIFETLYSSFNEKNCVTPEYLLSEIEISKTGYLPWGLYGRDIQLGKNTSVNQLIMSNEVSNKLFRLCSIFREYAKELKKNTPQRIKMESDLVKANSSAIFINQAYSDYEQRLYANKILTEIEHTLAQNDSLPLEMDLDGDRIQEQCAISKNNIIYINPKGAVISRFSVCSCLWDLCLHSGEGLFADTFINTNTGKKTNLSSKKFDLNVLDKNRQDFIASLTAIDLSSCQLNLVKRFKFRQNAVVVEVSIENTGNTAAEGFIYENTINLLLSDSCKINISEDESKQNFSIDDKSIPFTVNFGFSDPMDIEYKHIYQDIYDCLGERQAYQYTQIKIKKKLSLKPIQEDRVSLAMRIEKRKEKR